MKLIVLLFFHRNWSCVHLCSKFWLTNNFTWHAIIETVVIPNGDGQFLLDIGDPNKVILQLWRFHNFLPDLFIWFFCFNFHLKVSIIETCFQFASILMEGYLIKVKYTRRTSLCISEQATHSDHRIALVDQLSKRIKVNGKNINDPLHLPSN